MTVGLSIKRNKMERFGGTLDHSPRGARVLVRSVEAEGPSRQRLLNMGIFKGASVVVCGVAPLGDPMIVEVGESKVAIRKSDARNITVGTAEETAPGPTGKSARSGSRGGTA